MGPPQDLFPPKRRAREWESCKKENKPLARSLRPLPSAPGVEPSSHYLTRHLGGTHGSEVLGLEPESVAASPLGSHTYPCEKEPWFSSCMRAHENIWCIIMPLISSLHRLNTPVPLNNNPAIWFADTALAWMCFLAGGTSEEIDVLRNKSTHYSFFTISLLLIPAACIINNLDIVYCCKLQCILWRNCLDIITLGLCHHWDIGISPHVLNQWGHYFS